MPGRLLLWLVLVLLPLQVAIAEDTVAFVHANVIPMDHEAVLKDSTVVVSDGRIVNVGPSSSVTAPRGSRVIDARGKYLMPGFIDAHVHMDRKEELALFLLSGVTTVQGLGGNAGRSLHWTEDIASGKLLSPDYIDCDNVAEQKYTPDEVRDFVRKVAAEGYSCVKFYSPPDWTEDTYAAFSDEARKDGIRTIGHFPRNLDLKIAVRGLGSVAHAEEYLYTYFNKLPDRRNEADIPYAVQQTKEAGLGVIPNLVAYHRIGLQSGPAIDQLMKLPELDYVLQIVRDTWLPEHNRYRKSFNEEASKKLLSNYVFLQKMVLQMQKAGVPLATGTDASSNMPFIVEGASEHAEITELVAAGLTPYEALTAATAGGARVVGLAGEIGMIRKGMRANLVLLSANPLVDVANTSLIEGVMVRGSWFSRERLDQVKQQYLAWKGSWDNWMNAVLASADEASAAGALALARNKNIELDEEVLNNLGYNLLDDPATVPRAVAVLRFNSVAFSSSANAFDSLGEALAKNGQKEAAIQSYERSLSLNQDNTHAREMLEELRKGDGR